MNCPKCGKPIGSGAAFCMHCGQRLATQPAQPAQRPAGQQPSYAQPAYGGGVAFPVNPNQGRKQTILAVAIALGILVIALFGLSAAGVLKLGASNPDHSSLNAKGQTAGSILSQKGNTGPPALNAHGSREKPLEMPQDVWDWLEHLRKTEEKKNEIHLRQVADMKKFELMLGTLGPGMTELDPYDQTGDPGQEPAQYTATKFDDLRPAWRDLITFFKSVPPPDECKPIADDYFRALNEIPAMTGDIMDVLNTAARNPSEMLAQATKLKAKSYENIDRYLIQTDKRVQDICDKYNKHKWFNIKTDIQTGMLGKAGF